MSRNFDPITGDVLRVFLHYAIPSVIGMLAVTSAGVIDGIFIGHFVGAPALAAINISMPMFALLLAVVIMLAVGGSVMCGKFIGEGDAAAASDIFSRILYLALLVSVVISTVCLLYLDAVVMLLGANEELHPLVRIYMKIILFAAPLLVLGFTLDYFVRVDGRPLLASGGLVAIAVINILLDWLFIVRWDMGIEGAAWATSIAYGCGFFILITHLFHPRCTLRLVGVSLRWRGGWDVTLRAGYNGFSEFANELSIGGVTLLFNWVMITRLGVDGVAAFTIVGYLLMIGLEVCYGISESLQPTVSKNLGARQPQRIAGFVRTAVISVFFVGLTVSALLVLAPDMLISFFLNRKETGAWEIALAFIAVFWPAFLFSGINITLASYFTAMHKPLHSAAIAVSRSLLLPVAGLVLLPMWIGDTGVYLAIPAAEGLTFLLALGLAMRNGPRELIGGTKGG